MTEPLPDTWHNRDLPILRAIVRLFDEAPGNAIDDPAQQGARHVDAEEPRASTRCDRRPHRGHVEGLEEGQSEVRLAVGAAWADADGHLFTWQDGGPILPDYATKWFKATQKLEGLPELTLHGLRHTHITILLRDGVPVHVFAKRAGQRDPSVTLDVYADVIPEDDGSAVDVFAKAVWGA